MRLLLSAVLIFISSMLTSEECAGECEGTIPIKELNYLQKVTVNFPVTVVITKGDKNTYYVVGSEDSIKGMKIKAQGGELTISKKWLHFGAPRIDNVTIYITAKDLVAFRSKGRVSVIFQKFIGDKLWINSSERTMLTGDFTLNELNASFSGYLNARLTGRVRVQELSIDGSGSYDASACLTEEMYVDLEGNVIAQVAVTNLLHASLSGTTSLVYSGSPKDIQKAVTPGATIGPSSNAIPR